MASATPVPGDSVAVVVADVVSRLEEGGGTTNRLDTLARFATALNRHLVVSFPEKAPARLKDGVQVV